MFIFLFSLAWSVDATLWPYLLRSIIDIFDRYDFDRSTALEYLKPLLLYVWFFWFAVDAAFRTRGFLQAKAFPKLEAGIRMTMFEHVQHHSPKYFNSRFSGELAHKIGDMTAQVTVILESLLLFIPALVTCVISVILFFEIHALFAGILLAWVAIHIGICCFFCPKCAKYSDIHGASRSSLGGKIVDSLANNFAVNLFHRFTFERARIAKGQEEERKKNTEAKQYVNYLFLSASALFLIGSIVLSLFIVFYWSRNQLSTGQAVQIFNTSWNVVFCLWFVNEKTPPFFQALGVAKQAYRLMLEPKDVVDPLDARDLSVRAGEIVFENVSFQYGEKKIFDNKNVRIAPKEKVGLVGRSGAGKSTFINLILRFYPVEQGRILIDGQDISKVTLASLRRSVALIPQDPLLFHRSLKENITYGNPNASFEQVKEAARMAHCDSFIEKIEGGYEALVGERGTQLSGGERQRIAIARAVLSDAPVLILDEATSALDSITEKYIQESLDLLSRNRTTLVIAHRLSTLMKMDRILVFEGGKIVEEGTHFELLNRRGSYANMWKMQSGAFLPETGIP